MAGLTTKLELREKELKEIKESLKSQEEESEAYLTEIEDISKELDETQEQNSRLLVQISDKESNNQQLMREVCTHSLSLLETKMREVYRLKIS